MAYNQLAHYYDFLMRDAPYDKWHDFTNEMIREAGQSVESIVDLGCGTGEITTRLAKSGYQMTGVDFSSDMLSVAEQRGAKENLQIQWLQQDLLSLSGVENQDMAISYCDVVNYITEEDKLRKLFKNAADSLKSGGLFIFDVHSLNHVRHNLVNETFAEVYEDISYIWFCFEGEQDGEMYHDLTFFASDGDKYSRFDETHHQRTFSVELYRRLLQENGLAVQHLAADFSLNKKIDEDAERLFITAVKRSE
ncbi:class I SAM-dependent DNA methyltransferase [Lentibacillus persicus]|nr:class I SAM-dependent methyltransferase [Lentibacillus persicus]